MSIVERKRLAIQERNKNRSTEISYPQTVIGNIQYYKDEIDRLTKRNDELNAIIKTIKPLELFRDMLSFNCMQTGYTITIIQCSERKKKMGCNCDNRRKIITNILNTT